MTRHPVVLLLLTSFLLGATPPPAMAPGTYTNEEDRYFTGARGASPVPDWTGIEIGKARDWRNVDAFGKPLGAWQHSAPPIRASGGRIIGTSANGVATELRRAVPFTCWLSLRRTDSKPDGSADWAFQGGLMLHDQGGRAAASDPGAPGAVIRLRQVVWPRPSTSKPSLVLYVHKPEDPDNAVSYVWADPAANLIGINLRWVQGSCSRE